MEYQVTITETLSRIKSIEASSAFMAEEEVRRLYKKEYIVLDYSDLQEVQIKLSSPLFFKSTDQSSTQHFVQIFHI